MMSKSLLPARVGSAPDSLLPLKYTSRMAGELTTHAGMEPATWLPVMSSSARLAPTISQLRLPPRRLLDSTKFCRRASARLDQLAGPHAQVAAGGGNLTCSLGSFWIAAVTSVSRPPVMLL